MKNVKEETILQEYETADESGKKLLEKLYGKELFEKAPDHVSDFIKSCEKDGVKPEDILRFSNHLNAYQHAKNAEDMLEQLHKMEVGDWEPDWDNSTTKKWCPVFRMGSAFSFDYAVCASARTLAFGGSSLWFPTEDMATKFGEKYESLYKLVCHMPKRK